MNTRHSPSGIVTSGVVELAAAALSGWVSTLARQNPDQARRKLGIRNLGRIRQWHLDLAALGTATIALGLAVPDAPPPLQQALRVGGWTNAMLFLPLAFRPNMIDHPAYRTGVAASFATTSVGFTGMAAVAISRLRQTRRTH